MLSIYQIKDIIDWVDPLNLFPFSPNDEYDLLIKRIYFILKEKGFRDNMIFESIILEEIHSFFRETGSDIEYLVLNHKVLEAIRLFCFSEGNNALHLFENSYGLRRNGTYFFSYHVTVQAVWLLQDQGYEIAALQSFDSEFNPVKGNNINMHHGLSAKQILLFLEESQKSNTLYYRISALTV